MQFFGVKENVQFIFALCVCVRAFVRVCARTFDHFVHVKITTIADAIATSSDAVMQELLCGILFLLKIKCYFLNFLLVCNKYARFVFFCQYLSFVLFNSVEMSLF